MQCMYRVLGVCICMCMHVCGDKRIKREQSTVINDDPNKLQLQLTYSSAPKENISNFSNARKSRLLISPN